MLRWTLAYGRGGHLTRFPLFRTGHFESIFRSATQRCVVRGCPKGREDKIYNGTFRIGTFFFTVGGFKVTFFSDMYSANLQ